MNLRWIVVLLFCLSKTFYSQIPNESFEQWVNNEPVGWSTFNFLNPSITQSTDARSGSFSVKGEVISTGTGIIFPILISGIIGGHGFPISQRHANLTGYYKLNVVTTENLSVLVAPYKNGQVIGVGGLQFFAASDFTLFTIPIYYTGNEIPDSCQISITIGNNSGTAAVGSFFILDDLAFSGIATNIEESDDNLLYFSLEQNYPNPFNSGTTIKYSISKQADLSLKLYDLLGREVKVILEGWKNPGNYEINFNAGDLPSGTYIYKINAGNFYQTKKMILLR